MSISTQDVQGQFGDPLGVLTWFPFFFCGFMFLLFCSSVALSVYLGGPKVGFFVDSRIHGMLGRRCLVLCAQKCQPKKERKVSKTACSSLNFWRKLHFCLPRAIHRVRMEYSVFPHLLENLEEALKESFLFPTFWLFLKSRTFQQDLAAILMWITYCKAKDVNQHASEVSKNILRLERCAFWTEISARTFGLFSCSWMLTRVVSWLSGDGRV